MWCINFYEYEKEHEQYNYYEQRESSQLYTQPTYGFSNLESDVLMNPYASQRHRVNPIGTSTHVEHLLISQHKASIHR